MPAQEANTTIFVVTHEIPEDHGSHAIYSDEAEARATYDKWAERAAEGQITRMLTMDIRQLLDDALDEILWMRTVSEEDAGMEVHAETTKELTNIDAAYWKGQPIVKSLAKMANISKKDVRHILATMSLEYDSGDLQTIEMFLANYEIETVAVVFVVEA